MRSGVINSNSPMQDVLGILTGIWNQYKAGANKAWTVVKCPLFIHMEGVMEAGRNELPMAPNSTQSLSWTSKESSGRVIIRAGETGFEIPANAFCEITIFGNYGGNDAH